MISKDEIDRAILEHEAKDTTYANCERLAWLYIVRDHIASPEQKSTAKAATEILYEAVPNDVLNVAGDSDFIKAVNGKTSQKVFGVLNELLQTVYVLNPKLYTAVLESIKGIE